jgi:TPR repeat protein
MVGKFFYYGFCFERDYGEAVKWFQAAADQGNPSAQFLLGEAYEKGKGFKRDYVQAAKWYEQAAFNGDNHAIHHLSHLYAHGLGVRKNLIKAYAWNKLVEAHDWDMVKRLKAELETNMDQDQMDRAQILSIELKKKIRKPLP